MKKIALWLWALLALALASPGRAGATTYDIASDATAAAINSAITGANAGDTIIFTKGTYNLDETINITKSLTLEGNGATLNGRGNVRVIQISGAAEDVPININNFVIQGGYTNDSGGGLFVNTGCTVNITKCVFENNTAERSGGGICLNNESATLEAVQCTFKGNKAPAATNASAYDGFGGGVMVGGGTCNLTNCTFTGNGAKSCGGGLYTSATNTTVRFCTFVENTAETAANVCFPNTPTIPPITNSIFYAAGTGDVVVDTGGATSLDHCATTTGIGTNPVNLSGWTSQASSTSEKDGITHTVFRVDENSALSGVIGAATTDTGVTTDQLGNNRDAKPDIGAVEYTDSVTVIPEATSLSGTKGVALNETVTFSSTPDVGYTWTVTPTTPIAGVTAAINGSTLTLSGTPTATGTSTITVTGTSSRWTDGTATVTLTIGEITVKPTTTAIECKAGDTLNKTVTFTADGGTSSSYTWTQTATNPIAGVTASISEEGILTLSGTPTATGTMTVTVTAQEEESGGSGTAS
ncbi:MAG: glycoside hydrolase family 55 protein, partial [Fretibacterium sp.]|nr:glycoside hydrolase family 55 protein [Fretibacterium sp.]